MHEPQSDRKSFSRLLFRDSGLSGVGAWLEGGGVEFKDGGGRGRHFGFYSLCSACQGLVLDPTDGLHLVGVSLGAELVVVSVLALVSVPLQNVLVTTVTGELVGHPAGEGRERKLLECLSQ